MFKNKINTLSRSKSKRIDIPNKSYCRLKQSVNIKLFILSSQMSLLSSSDSSSISNSHSECFWPQRIWNTLILTLSNESSNRNRIININVDSALGYIINNNYDFNSELTQILIYHEFENQFESFVTIEDFISRLSYFKTKHGDDFVFEFSKNIHEVLLLKMSTIFEIRKTIKFNNIFL